jgi:hypothetical protein
MENKNTIKVEYFGNLLLEKNIFFIKFLNFEIIGYFFSDYNFPKYPDFFYSEIKKHYTILFISKNRFFF